MIRSKCVYWINWSNWIEVTMAAHTHILLFAKSAWKWKVKPLISPVSLYHSQLQYHRDHKGPRRVNE